MKVLATTVATAALLFTAACNNNDRVAETDPAATAPAVTETPSVPPAETAAGNAEEFVRLAARSNLLEIQTSEVALQKSKNPQVREFAQMMIDDHKKATDQLQQVATTANLTVPTTFDDTGPLENLRNVDAEGFDDAYLDAQVDMHEDTIRRFESYAASGDNPALQKLATDLLPQLRVHLERAETIRKTVNEG